MSEKRGQQGEINRLLQSIDQIHANQDELLSPEAEPLLAGHEPERTEIIHVYVVREGEEEEQPGERVVDSTLAAAEGEQSSSFDVGDPGFCPTT